jgi:hypothetical protein
MPTDEEQRLLDEEEARSKTQKDGDKTKWSSTDQLSLI